MSALKKLKAGMCGNKVSFRTEQLAQKVADKFEQRIYECPVCFCWHTTSRQSWQDDFISRDSAEKMVRIAVMNARTEFNNKLKEKNTIIYELEKRLGKKG